MREANSSEVQELKVENVDLKELVAELSMEVRKLKSIDKSHIQRSSQKKASFLPYF